MYSVWDNDSMGDELIANIYEKFGIIQKSGKELRWYNMYVARENKTGKVIENVWEEACKIAKRLSVPFNPYIHTYYTHIHTHTHPATISKNKQLIVQ